jgi:hypothetical protein
MENFKNVNFVLMVVVSFCLTLFFMGRMGWTGFSSKVTFLFGTIAFGIMSIAAITAFISKRGNKHHS